MIQNKCVECGSSDGVEVLNISNEKDTYLDYLKIEYLGIVRNYIKCNSCGLIYRNITLDDGEKELLYKHFRDYDLRQETKEEYFKRITSLPEDESENFAKTEFLSDYLDNDIKNKVLDVGCGAGVFLYTFSKIFSKWDCLGVEPTKEFSDIAKVNGIDIVNEYLDKNTFNTKFDLITANHVLEHLSNYYDMLNMLKDYLADDGLLYIEVPSDKNIGHLEILLMIHLCVFMILCFLKSY